MEDLESLKCLNCSSFLNNNSNAPIILNCGHTICKKCLENIFKRMFYVKCPFDNQKFFYELNNYPINYMALEYVEKYTKEIQKKSKILFH